MVDTFHPLSLTPRGGRARGSLVPLFVVASRRATPQPRRASWPNGARRRSLTDRLPAAGPPAARPVQAARDARRDVPAVLRWLPVLAWMAVIFGLSSIPNLRFAPEDLLDTLIRKTGHAGVFGILALLLLFALGRRDGAARLAVLGSALYAISDEFHQGFVAGRHPSQMDTAIDAIGATLALVAYGAARRWWLGRRSRSGSR